MKTNSIMHITNKNNYAELNENEAVLVTKTARESFKIETQVVGEEITLALKFGERLLFQGMGHDLEWVMEAVTAMIQLRENNPSRSLLDLLPPTDYGRALRKFLTS